MLRALRANTNRALKITNRPHNLYDSLGLCYSGRNSLEDSGRELIRSDSTGSWIKASDSVLPKTKGQDRLYMFHRYGEPTVELRSSEAQNLCLKSNSWIKSCAASHWKVTETANSKIASLNQHNREDMAGLQDVFLVAKVFRTAQQNIGIDMRQCKNVVNSLSKSQDRFFMFYKYRALSQTAAKLRCSEIQNHCLKPSCFNSSAISYSTSAEIENSKNAEAPKQEELLLKETQEDVLRREEMVGFMVDHDVSSVAKELKVCHQEMMTNMRKCSRVLFAFGATHMVWGGIMFYLLESPLNHAIMTEVCMSSLVVLGLAYQMKQTLKPVELFAKLEEHRRPRIIFLSRQISRMLGAFFYRGSGIGFVLSLTLTAHLISCSQFFF